MDETSRMIQRGPGGYERLVWDEERQAYRVVPVVLVNGVWLDEADMPPLTDARTVAALKDEIAWLRADLKAAQEVGRAYRAEYLRMKNGRGRDTMTDETGHDEAAERRRNRYIRLAWAMHAALDPDLSEEALTEKVRAWVTRETGRPVEVAQIKIALEER